MAGRSLTVLVGVFALLRSIPAPALDQFPEKKPAVRVRTVDYASVEGTLISLSLDGGLRIEVDGELRHIATIDLITVSCSEVDSNSSHEEEWGLTTGHDGVGLDLVGGDRVFGRLGDSQPEFVVVESEPWGKLSVPMDALAGVLFSSAGLPAYADSLDWFRRDSDSADDRLLLTNGDVVRGFIAGVGRDGVRLEIADEVKTVPLRLAVAARLVHPPAQASQGPHAIISLVDGQRLTVAALEWSGGKVKARRSTGETVEPAADQIRSVAFQGGRWEWLSAKVPSSSQQVAMLSMEWKHMLDRNVLGGPLRVAGGRYERGIGVHSKSVLEYDLDGAYREFVTSFGMDDNSGRGANVKVVILVDGQQRFERADVVAGVLHGPVRVDVSGARRLELVVDFGLNGDIQDRFDWIEPGLVK